MKKNITTACTRRRTQPGFWLSTQAALVMPSVGLNDRCKLTRGHHYLPQYYLKGFTESKDNMLWAFEKGNGAKFNTQVKKLANIKKFYSEEIEQKLADDIEGPGNIVLDKIRNREPIDDNDKSIFSEYIAVMWKRVPRAKEDLKIWPHV